MFFSGRFTVGLTAFVVHMMHFAVTYNLDPDQPIVRRGLNGDGAFFGYSVAQLKDSVASWLVVGAPRDNTSLLNDLNVNSPGAVYRCQIRQRGTCEVINVDTNYTYGSDFYTGQLKQRDILSNQWLGSSVSATNNGMIVACAHRYVDKSLTLQEWYPTGHCKVLDRNLKQLFEYTPCKDGGPHKQRGVRGISYCQAGSSVKISEDGSLIAVGGPGAYIWQGISGIVRPNVPNVNINSGKNSGAEGFDYLGYSTDIGQFGFVTADELDVVVGAPRYNDYFGRVAIFEFNFDASVYIPVLAIDGQQFGAYFGHSVIAVDLNNDKLDDLVVGAPLFSESQYDQGRVYVYLNNVKTLELNRVLTGDTAGGRFGYAITKAGDLNKDSFNDVVISAPYANGGVVYVYHGSVSGVLESPSQTITASSVNYTPHLMGFGVSLSGGMDLDNNEYPDVLVGAYLSERAVLLRSKPIADVQGTITFKPQFVNYPNSTELVAEACLRYDGISLPGQLDFTYTVSVEEQRVSAGLNSRGVFVNTMTAMVAGNITTRVGTDHCTNFTLMLRKDIKDLLSPIPAVFTYQIAGESTLPAADGDPDITQSLIPVLRQQAVNSGSGQAYLLRDCGDDVRCIPDLQVTSVAINLPEGENAIVLGRVTEVTVAVSVKNVGENAYLAKLIATFQESVTFNVVAENKLISCEGQRNVDGTVVTCEIGNPLTKGSSVDFGMRIGVQGLTSAGKNFVVSVQATSENMESNSTLADNTRVTADYRIIALAKFGVEGIPLPERLSFDLSNPSVDVRVIPTTELEIGSQHINHTYYVINDGPSRVTQSELVVNWPGKALNNRYLLYIVDLRLVGSGSCDQGVINPANLTTVAQLDAQRNLSSVGVGGEIIRRERRSTEEKQNLKRTRRAETLCPGSSYSVCFPIVCQLYNLDPADTVELRVISRLYERTLIQDNVVEVNFSSHAAISTDVQHLQVLAGLSKSFSVTTRINEPDPVVSNESLQTWVVAVVVIFTVLILIGVVVLLFFLGFFKRAKKEQLEREREELEGKGDVVGATTLSVKSHDSEA